MLKDLVHVEAEGWECGPTQPVISAIQSVNISTIATDENTAFANSKTRCSRTSIVRVEAEGMGLKRLKFELM